MNQSNQNTNIDDPNNDNLIQESPPKLSKLDKNIISATKALTNPTKSNIANHVVELGGAKHIQTVYKRLRAKDYLQGGIQDIETFHNEFLQRELAPLALRNIKKVYKDKSLAPKERFSYDKLIADKMYGEKHVHTGRQQVNIGSVERIQVMINNSLTNETLESVSSNDAEYSEA